MTATTGLATTLFGKIPTQGDFVRTGSLGPLQAEFEDWLLHSVQQSRGAVPSAPIRFVYATRNGERLIGLFVASADAVGRTFPLALLHRVPAALAAQATSVLIALYDDFLDAAESSLVGCVATSLDAVGESLASWPDPGAGEVTLMLRGAHEVLVSEPVAVFTARVFGDARQDPLPYSLWVMQQSSTQLTDPVVLDAPIREELDVYVWLELLRASVRGRETLGLLWSTALGRALLSTAPLSDQALAFLVEPEHASQRRWPLWSQKQSASEQARSSLGAERCLAVDAASSLHDLIAATAALVPS